MKNVDEPKAPSQSHTTKQKPVSTDTKAPVKQPHVDTDVPVTKNLPEAKVSELKKVDADLPETNIKKVDTEVDTPKDKQIANGEKPPKSEILEDNPNLKDKDLDNFKKYEDDVDPSTKKKMKEDADSDVGKGKNHDSKSKALMMARVIAEANDKVDKPIAALMLELAPLKAMKGVKGFDYEKGNAPGELRILMFGSEYIVDPSYTTKRQRDFDKEVQDKLDSSEIDAEMAKKLREYNKEVPNGTLEVDEVMENMHNGEVFDPNTKRFGDPNRIDGLSRRDEYLGSSSKTT